MIKDKKNILGNSVSAYIAGCDVLGAPMMTAFTRTPPKSTTSLIMPPATPSAAMLSKFDSTRFPSTSLIMPPATPSAAMLSKFDSTRFPSTSDLILTQFNPLTSDTSPEYENYGSFDVKEEDVDWGDGGDSEDHDDGFNDIYAAADSNVESFVLPDFEN